MSRRQVVRPLVRGLRQPMLAHPWAVHAVRPFSASSCRLETTTEQPPPPSPPPPEQPPPPAETDPKDLDPNTAIGFRVEKALAKAGTPPIGSRRRRAALRTSQNIPFLEMPFQCFQEALKVIAEDREKKVAKIKETMERIQKLEQSDGSQFKKGAAMKELKLKSLRKFLENQKILADINSPIVKKKFEDGLGDMDKPIYRYLADQKWRVYDHKLITQRIQQHKIVPDILPKFDAVAEVDLYFRRKKIPPGQTLDSSISEVAPRLRVQVFDKGERLVSVVAIDPDVPDQDKDGFMKRCHFMAANIPLSPTINSIAFSKIRGEDQLALPWLPAFAQKGSDKHRIAIFLLEQGDKKIDVAKLKELYSSRDGFSLKSFKDKFGVKPVGFNMFRTEWDENTADVMERAGLPGAHMEFRRTRVYSLKPPRKAKGWEAKRQGPKYKHLWKYTKRIRGLSNARGWTRRGN